MYFLAFTVSELKTLDSNSFSSVCVLLLRLYCMYFLIFSVSGFKTFHSVSFYCVCDASDIVLYVFLYILCVKT